MTILVADDNLASRELMREVLEASGHRVVEATNGREALDLIHRDPPDVVFLDLQMPVLDGFCVVRQLPIHARFYRLPAKPLTASSIMRGMQFATDFLFSSEVNTPDHLNHHRKQSKHLTGSNY